MSYWSGNMNMNVFTPEAKKMDGSRQVEAKQQIKKHKIKQIILQTYMLIALSYYYKTYMFKVAFYQDPM